MNMELPFSMNSAEHPDAAPIQEKSSSPRGQGLPSVLSKGLLCMQLKCNTKFFLIVDNKKINRSLKSYFIAHLFNNKRLRIICTTGAEIEPPGLSTLILRGPHALRNSQFSKKFTTASQGAEWASVHCQ